MTNNFKITPYVFNSKILILEVQSLLRMQLTGILKTFDVQKNIIKQFFTSHFQLEKIFILTSKIYELHTVL